jgi:MFS family permease
MIALAPTAQRGRFVGVFNAVTGVGYAAGPLTLVLVGSEGWAPLAVGILSFVACAMLLAATTGRLVGLNDGSPSKGVLHFWKVVPVLLIAVIVSAAVQQSTYSLLLVFGTSYGLAEATLVALIIALSLGNIVLQLPLGLMAERFSAKAMIEICAIISLAGALLMPILVTTPAIWLLMLMMGGVGFGLYTMALVELGNNFSGSTLVAGNAAFGLMWGVGGILGAPVAGVAMQTVGPDGLPYTIAVLTGLLIVFSRYRRKVSP